jgi:hypothetical protein
MKTIIKENEGFRLILNKSLCLQPDNLYNIEMTGQQLKDGEVMQSSTYQFFMTQEDINALAKALTA